MIIVCPSCQSRYKFDENKLGGRPKVKTRCAKCGGTIEIENPMMGAMTLPPTDMSPAPPPPAIEEKTRPNAQQPVPRPAEVSGSTVTAGDLHKIGALKLPTDKRYSLA